ncbi:MAG: hypothetical protein JSW70_05685 [Syntrophobacterales bacterium]|nr:MAG: hypothetical protein JSW70_05685 [Syntrophobacterales bacterium]
MDAKKIEEEFRKRLEIAKRNAEKEALEFILKKLEDTERIRDFQSLLLRCREIKGIVTTRLGQIHAEIRGLR